MHTKHKYTYVYAYKHVYTYMSYIYCRLITYVTYLCRLINH